MKYIGLEKTKDRIIFSIIEKKRSSFTILAKQIFSLNSLDVKQLYMLLKEKNNIIISGLDSQKCILKHLSVPVKNEKYLNSILSNQKDSLSKINEKDSLLQTKIFNENNDLSFVLYFITTNKNLALHLQEYKNISIQPDFISSIPYALFSFAQNYAKNIADMYLIHFGYESTHCILIKNNILIKAHNISIGSDTFTQSIPSNRKKKIDLLQYNKNVLTHFHQKISQFNNDIYKIFLSFQKELLNERIPILITGNLDSFENIIPFFYDTVHSFSSTIINNDIDDIKILAPYASCIGLALEQIFEKKPLQFRQNDDLSTKSLSRLGKNIFISILLCCTLIGLTFFLCEKKYREEEKKIESMVSSIIKQEENILPLDYLMNTPWKDKLTGFEEKINQESKIFPYFLLVPNVSEVLHSLNSASFLNDNHTIEITHFDYELEEYARVGAPQLSALAKVELTFIPNTLTTAKKFHQWLQKNTQLINQSKEINWEAYENKYKTSFYLKNKTIEDLFEEL